jgi:hypothetical protein
MEQVTEKLVALDENPVYAAAEVTILSGLSLQEEQFLPLPIFLYNAPFGENRVRQTDRCTLTILCVYIYISLGAGIA